MYKYNNVYPLYQHGVYIEVLKMMCMLASFIPRLSARTQSLGMRLHASLIPGIPMKNLAFLASRRPWLCSLHVL